MGINVTLLYIILRCYFNRSLLGLLKGLPLRQDMDYCTEFARLFLMLKETGEQDCTQEDLRVEGIKKGFLSIILQVLSYTRYHYRDILILEALLKNLARIDKVFRCQKLDLNAKFGCRSDNSLFRSILLHDKNEIEAFFCQL